MRKELLSPAGNPEKLRAALSYGADAVYLAGNRFGMRAAADNFSTEELREAAALTHRYGKKIYLTLNTMPRTQEYPALYRFLDEISDIGIDAVIAADLGVISAVQKRLPEAEIHISTQTSIVSAEAAEAYLRLGARRVVLSRELTFAEIADIRKSVSRELELEAFIHGSMCISYSGRCLISNHFTGRDANRGACAQPCRWNYHMFKIAEEKRPDDRLGIEETELGTFLFSSKDLCMIEHIPELMESGIDSFKIEGRMKSAYYAAVVTNAYRIAIDSYLASPEQYTLPPQLQNELDSVSHREYDTGFFFASPMSDAKVAKETGYIREKAYIAVAVDYDEKTGLASFMQKNKIVSNTEAELLSPGKTGRKFNIGQLYDADGGEIDSAPHPFMIFKMKTPFPVCKGDILRK